MWHHRGRAPAAIVGTIAAMTGQADRLQRLGSLFAYLLQAEVPKTRAEIEAEFDFYEGASGRRRFEDDKAALLRAGIPLETVAVADGTGYVIRSRDYAMPDVPLDDDELQALDLAVAAVDFQGVSWAHLASAKLDVPGLRPEVLTELPGIEVLPLIDDAVLTRTRLRFRYRDEDRTVDPWGVAFKHGRWYLVGFDHLRGDHRCYRLDRLPPDTLEPDGDPAAFERPADLDPAALVPDDATTMGDGELRQARLRIDRRIAELVAGTVVEEDDDHVVVELQVSHEGAFVAQVLGWGELAEVLGPPELRRAVIDRLRELGG